MEINHFISIPLLVAIPAVLIFLVLRGFLYTRKKRASGIRARLWPYALGLMVSFPYALCSFFLYSLLWWSMLHYPECQSANFIESNRAILIETPTNSQSTLCVFFKSCTPEHLQPVCLEYIIPAYRPPNGELPKCVVYFEEGTIDMEKRKNSDCIYIPLEEYHEWMRDPEAKKTMLKKWEELQRKKQRRFL